MCGICGVYKFNDQSVLKDEIKIMMSLLKHRGPDDEGFYINGNIGLGHLRLSIIDLSSAGHQPMFSDDGRYCIIYNGEVYNYKELRKELGKYFSFVTKTDTEVVLKAYIKWGPKCLTRFNGMFSFVILDISTNDMFLARDRFGIKPFYYSIDSEKFIFASEERSILAAIKNVDVNHQAVFEYLIYNRTDQGDQTFFKDIVKFPKGHYAFIKDKQLSFYPWYLLEEQIKGPVKDTEEFLQLFKSSLNLRLRSDVPVGVCLSGGLDSSSIVSMLINDFGKKDLNTFSATYEKDDVADESEYIAEYKKHLKYMYFTKPSVQSLLIDLNDFIDCHSEPVSTLGPYAQFKVFKLAKNYVKVTLDGQGADEELAGYHYFFGIYFKELLLKMNISRFNSEMKQYLSNYKSIFAIKYFLYYLIPLSLKDHVSRLSHNYVNKDYYFAHKYTSDVKSKLYHPKTLNESLLQHFKYKLEHLLKWEDHNSMWHSIEARVPFLDHNIVEKVLSLPSNKLIYNAQTKYLLRESMKDILPESIRIRQDKIGFATPWERWFKEAEFKKTLIGLLHDSSLKRDGILDTDKCLKDYKKHLDGHHNVSKEIWKWVNLELWYRRFIEN